jgi:hypothetical protein
MCVADGSAGETDGFGPRGGGRRLRLGDARKLAVGFERGLGARSAAGGMTALSLAPNVRGHGCKTYHYRMQAEGPAYELAV